MATESRFVSETKHQNPLYSVANTALNRASTKHDINYTEKKKDFLIKMGVVTGILIIITVIVVYLYASKSEALTLTSSYMRKIANTESTGNYPRCGLRGKRVNFNLSQNKYY